MNSIDTDGVKNGFDLELLDAVAARCAVPIIASGGAGKKEDFLELFRNSPGSRCRSGRVDLPHKAGGNQRFEAVFAGERVEMRV